MGREIRRVPPDWQHPREIRWDYGTRREVSSFRPLLDQTVEEAQAEWDRGAAEWPGSERAAQTWSKDHTWDDGTSVKSTDLIYGSYEDYAGARPAELYADDDEEVSEVHRGTPTPYRTRSWTADEATHFQVYETVSEGTPVSPVLPSLEAVVEWAVGEGYTREQAEGFVKWGSARSMMLVGGRLYDGIEAGELHKGGAS